MRLSICLLLFCMTLRYACAGRMNPQIQALIDKFTHAGPFHKDPINLSIPHHKIRASYENLTWGENKRIMSGAGHTWCGIYRDNWSCAGKRYENVLNSTKPFNATKYKNINRSFYNSLTV